MRAIRVLALDIGEKRVGIAVSDPGESVASPICVLSREECMNNAKSFQRVFEDWGPDMLLCGLPISLDGEEGPQAKRIRQDAQTIAANMRLELEFVDERLSSSAAKRSLREKGYDEKAMRGKVDMIAACIFLQSWLDARKQSSARSDR